jgi:outer membrane protein OmpA-like peptidoglycan-associated protein
MSPRIRFLSTSFALAVSLLANSGCQSLGPQTRRQAAVGAAAGTVAGSVLGTFTGSTVQGAIIGAVLGGAAGGLIGRDMDEKAREIHANIPDAQVTRLGEGLVVAFPSQLLFDVGSDRLRSDSKSDLNRFVSSISEFGDSRLLLVGHTDNIGAPDFNLALSTRRANAVAKYLESRGLGAERIAVTGVGESEPVESNATEEGRQLNRRVEVAVYAGEQMRARARAKASPN